MISNLAQTGGGSELIHELSRPYPTYSEAETSEKIRRALEEKKPHTCAYIRDSLGFSCPSDCGVKAPVVHAAMSRAERMRALIDAQELDIGDVFSSETLALLVYAKAERPADYAALKQRLRGKVSLRDLDNAVAKTGATMRAPNGGENAPLCLEGIDLRGAVAPGNWEISLERGVRRDVTTKAGNTTVMACASALVITRRTQNIDDGMAARVLELHGKPTENAEFARSLHKISEQNYGHAGRCYAEFLKRSLQNDAGMIQRDYARMHEHLKLTHDNAHFLEYVATVCLGDYYAEIAFFGGEEAAAFDAAAKNGTIMLQNAGEFALKEDIVDRAWHFVRDWCVANEKAFTDDAAVSYGVKQDERTFYVLKFALDDALKRQNYPVEKCKTGFFERGYMPTFNGKRQKQKKTNGSLRWYYVVELSGGYADGDIVPLSDRDSER